MKSIQVTIQEIWAAMRPSVHKNKKRYQRKPKYPKKDQEESE
jgi:hypothetical protein